MPLDKASLTASIKVLFGANETGLDAAAKANIEQMSSDLADAIDTFVKSGLVTVSSNGATLVGTPGGPLTITALPGTGSVT